ncbi:hypothetical protein DVH24_014735 [Malus domestica]|uniref:Uncharacterized protein n=1 Tax=Malus domestica TaxID=3750 RepID=A0A498K1R7_MALDO|nr:hypothetical protein DVH24_014735 [Malus domestica]
MDHPSWDCSRANSLNFGVPMEPEANELSKGLMLGRDENIHNKTYMIHTPGRCGMLQYTNG